MEIAIKLPDKLAKELKELSNNREEQGRIINQAIKEKIERIKKFKNDPFTKWILKENSGFKDKSDLSVNHDKYLYGTKK